MFAVSALVMAGATMVLKWTHGLVNGEEDRKERNE